MSTEYRICNRCVMDTSDEDIVFDELGNCNHCNELYHRMTTYISPNSATEAKFLRLVEHIKRVHKNQKYDCIIGISGGIDSTYLTYKLVSFGLRPLVMHLDNGWDTEMSVKNMKKIINKFNLDYESCVLDWHEFREIQLGFIKSSIVDMEMPTDMAIYASLFKAASKYKVKYIFSGCNYTGEGILPLTWGYHVFRDMKIYRHIVKEYSSIKLKTLPTVSLLQDLYFRYIKGIKFIYPYDYLAYNKDDAKAFLINEIGWEELGGKHHESRVTAFWHSYVMPNKYNMDYRRATYSSQICYNQVTRAEALEQLKKPPYNIEKINNEKIFFAKKYQITLEQFEHYLSLPPKVYKDFPNQKNFIQFLRKIYNKFFK